MTLKTLVCIAAGMCGAIVTSLFGVWTAALTTMCIFMLTDYITGIIVAGVFRNSDKSVHGGLESRAGFRGIIKKGMCLCVVIIAYRLDLLLGMDYIRNVTVITISANELISIVENAGLMGVPMPAVIIRAIDLLKERGEDG